MVFLTICFGIGGISGVFTGWRVYDPAVPRRTQTLGFSLFTQSVGGMSTVEDTVLEHRQSWEESQQEMGKAIGYENGFHDGVNGDIHNWWTWLHMYGEH